MDRYKKKRFQFNSTEDSRINRALNAEQLRHEKRQANFMRTHNIDLDKSVASEKKKSLQELVEERRKKLIKWRDEKKRRIEAEKKGKQPIFHPCGAFDPDQPKFLISQDYSRKNKCNSLLKSVFTPNNKSQIWHFGFNSCGKGDTAKKTLESTISGMRTRSKKLFTTPAPRNKGKLAKPVLKSTRAGKVKGDCNVTGIVALPCTPHLTKESFVPSKDFKFQAPPGLKNYDFNNENVATCNISLAKETLTSNNSLLDVTFTEDSHEEEGNVCSPKVQNLDSLSFDETDKTALMKNESSVLNVTFTEDPAEQELSLKLEEESEEEANTEATSKDCDVFLSTLNCTSSNKVACFSDRTCISTNCDNFSNSEILATNTSDNGSINGLPILEKHVVKQTNIGCENIPNDGLLNNIPALEKYDSIKESEKKSKAVLSADVTSNDLLSRDQSCNVEETERQPKINVSVNIEDYDKQIVSQNNNDASFSLKKLRSRAKPSATFESPIFCRLRCRTPCSRKTRRSLAAHSDNFCLENMIPSTPISSVKSKRLSRRNTLTSSANNKQYSACKSLECDTPISKSQDGDALLNLELQTPDSLRKKRNLVQFKIELSPWITCERGSSSKERKSKVSISDKLRGLFDDLPLGESPVLPASPSSEGLLPLLQPSSPRPSIESCPLVWAGLDSPNDIITSHNEESEEKIPKRVSFDQGCTDLASFKFPCTPIVSHARASMGSACVDNSASPQFDEKLGNNKVRSRSFRKSRKVSLLPGMPEAPSFNTENRIEPIIEDLISFDSPVKAKIETPIRRSRRISTMTKAL